MKLKRIEKHSREVKQIRRIFLEAFPREERPPYPMLVRRIGHECADFWGIYEADQLVGMAYVIRGKGTAYLFFFAMEKSCRGKGYGGQALRELQKTYAGQKFYLAREQLDEKADNYAQRVRRHGFYLKNGMVDMPCTITEANVTFDVMGIGGIPTREEYMSAMKAYLGIFSPVLKRDLRETGSKGARA